MSVSWRGSASGVWVFLILTPVTDHRHSEHSGVCSDSDLPTWCMAMDLSFSFFKKNSGRPVSGPVLHGPLSRVSCVLSDVLLLRLGQSRVCGCATRCPVISSDIRYLLSHKLSPCRMCNNPPVYTV